MASVMSFPTRIVYGKGAIQELPAELRRASVSRPLLVTDKGILQAGLLRFVTPLLEQAGVKAQVFSEFEANPTDADALRGIEAYRAAGADGVLGVGGGASLDMAKAIALLVNHAPPLAQYDDAKGGDARITAPVPPILQVPTTAGTGSEVGRSTVLVIDGTKTVIFSPALMAKVAILDPELTVGLPPFITAATGVRAWATEWQAPRPFWKAMAPNALPSSICSRASMSLPLRTARSRCAAIRRSPSMAMASARGCSPFAT